MDAFSFWRSSFNRRTLPIDVRLWVYIADKIQKMVDDLLTWGFVSTPSCNIGSRKWMKLKSACFPHASRRLRLDSKVVRKKLTTPKCFSVELVGQPHIRNIFNGICTTNLTMWVDLFSNDGDFLISNRLIMLFRYLNPPLPEAPSYNSNQVALDRPIS